MLDQNLKTTNKVARDCAVNHFSRNIVLTDFCRDPHNPCDYCYADDIANR